MSDVVVAGSAELFQHVFDELLKRWHFSASDKVNFGWGWASYEVEARCTDGSLEFQDPTAQFPNGSFWIHELDITWTTLRVTLAIDIPEVCVGGQCVLWRLDGSCAAHAPKVCFFSGSPEFSVDLSLGDIIQHEIDVSCAPKIVSTPASWDLHGEIRHIDVDILDIPGMLENVINKLAEKIDSVLSGAPGWIRRAVRRALGDLATLLERILDFGDDFDQWLSNLLGQSLGLVDALIQYFGNEFLDEHPLYSLPNPYTVQQASFNLRLPISGCNVSINHFELLIEADVRA